MITGTREITAGTTGSLTLTVIDNN
jgi:hypothetical protein